MASKKRINRKQATKRKINTPPAVNQPLVPKKVVPLSDVIPPKLTNDPIVGSIQITKVYDKFFFFEANRPTSSNKLLQDSIDKVGQIVDIITTRPVDDAMIKECRDLGEEELAKELEKHKGKMGVIDGQNRLEESKKLDLPIEYRIKDVPMNLVIKYIQDAQIGKTWTDIERAKSFVKVGRKDYNYYVDFKNEFGFTHNMNLAWLYGSYKNNSTHNGVVLNLAFKNGSIVFGERQYNIAVQEARRLKEIMFANNSEKPIHRYWKKRTFLLAYFFLIKKTKNYKHDRMVKQMHKFGDEYLKPQQDVKDYFLNLVKIYELYCREDQRLSWSWDDMDGANIRNF